MTKINQPHRVAIVLFVLTTGLFFIFFAYIFTDHIHVYQAEQTHHYTTMTDLERTVETDDTAPAGIRKFYRGVLDSSISPESCLCFNIAHHAIEVYFDDTLVYRLTTAEENRISQNVSNNWCSVHIGQEVLGKSITVILTPLFDSAISKEPVFLVGSHYSIAVDVILGELPLLILSALCVLLGIFLVVIALYDYFTKKSISLQMLYLGSFSICLGLWKLMDLNSMPLLVPEQALAFGYLSVGSLFLGGPCLMLYFNTFFEKDCGKLHRAACCISLLLCLYVLAQQLLGIAELRDNLIIGHFLLIAALLSIPANLLYSRIFHKEWGLRRSLRLLLLLFVGIAVDLVLYYHDNQSGLIFFSIICFIVYTLIVFLQSIQETTHKAYTDSRTGLGNRLRWSELMLDSTPLPEPYGILFVDLNGLKRVNDTLGHEAGDRMIYALSNLLRNTLPRSSTICRWGGDEFAVLLIGTKRAELDRQVEALLTAGAQYNTAHPGLPLHFAIGTALSTEHPGIARSELFHLADEDMYHHKQQWYTKRT